MQNSVLVVYMSQPFSNIRLPTYLYMRDNLRFSLIGRQQSWPDKSGKRPTPFPYFQEKRAALLAFACKSRLCRQRDERRTVGSSLMHKNLKSLGSSSFARHYSRNRCLLSLPLGTKMFQFPRLPLPILYIQIRVTRHYPSRVPPFGHPRFKACLAAPRGLSQPTTSFIGILRQGILCVRLSNFLRFKVQLTSYW